MRLLVFIILLLVSTSLWATDPPVKFIENKNQFGDGVHFAARISGGSMQLHASGFSYYFLNTSQTTHTHQHENPELQSNDSDDVINGRYLEVSFIGANKNAVPQAFGRSKEYYNYFLGKDSCRWASKAFAYQGVFYADYYKGIDLKIYGQDEDAKYDFVVSPHADPDQIQFSYAGMDALLLNGLGDIEVQSDIVTITEKKPIAYQIIEGEKRFVPCSFQLNKNYISFTFPNGYDACYTLVIDPLLIFSTYSGSRADNWGSTATPGERGTLYSAGVVNHFAGINFSGTYPATPGAFQTTYGGLYDIGILKYDSAGTQLLYASYLGGADVEFPHSLVVNKQNELIVLGTTGSPDFPTTLNAIQQDFAGGTSVSIPSNVGFQNGTDLIIARISSDGASLLASTYFGGTANDGINPHGLGLTRNYGDHMRGDVITDEIGNIFVSSVSASADLVASNNYFGGATDALLLKLDDELSILQISMFIGGTDVDAAHSIKLAQDKTIYLAGGTTSSDFPVTENAYQKMRNGPVDGWIAHISSAGSILEATYCGSDKYDQVYFVDLNTAGEVYTYGQTDGAIPVTPATIYNNPNSGQFVQKFSSDLSSLILSTVVGSGRGFPDISPTAFLVSDCNTIYLAGWGGALNNGTDYWPGSSTQNLPVTNEALQRTTSGSDLYFMVLADDAATFLYGTYFGGGQSLTHVDGGTSRFDKNGLVYHAVCASCGGSDRDFITTSTAWSRVNRSLNCNNLAFKLDLASLTARIQTNSVALDMPGINKLCLPDKIVFENKSSGGETYEWNFGDGSPVLIKKDLNPIVHEYLEPDKRYTVWLKAVDKGTCKVKDSVSVYVDVFEADGVAQENDDLCEGASYQLTANGGALYEWWTEDLTFQSTQRTPLVSPVEDTKYYVRITEDNGCARLDSVTLKVTPLIDVNFELSKFADCFSIPEVTVMNTTENVASNDLLYFDFGDGFTSDLPQLTYTYEEEGVYVIKLVGVREEGNALCITEEAKQVNMYSLFVPNVITPGAEDGLNDSFIIQYGKETGITPLDAGLKMKLKVINRWGASVFETDDYQNNFTGAGLSSGVYYFEITIEDNATCRSWLQIIKGDN